MNKITHSLHKVTKDNNVMLINSLLIVIKEHVFVGVRMEYELKKIMYTKTHQISKILIFDKLVFIDLKVIPI